MLLLAAPLLPAPSSMMGDGSTYLPPAAAGAPSPAGRRTRAGGSERNRAEQGARSASASQAYLLTARALLHAHRPKTPVSPPAPSRPIPISPPPLLTPARPAARSSSIRPSTYLPPTGHSPPIPSHTGRHTQALPAASASQAKPSVWVGHQRLFHARTRVQRSRPQCQCACLQPATCVQQAPFPAASLTGADAVVLVHICLRICTRTVYSVHAWRTRVFAACWPAVVCVCSLPCGPRYRMALLSLLMIYIPFNFYYFEHFHQW
jgi:hypothetical protein